MITKNGEWWEYSWNIAPGCTRVGPECDNCWALAMAKRLKGMKKFGYKGLVDEKGKWTGRITLFDERLELPLKMKPKVIAVNLMGDLFHPNIPQGWQLKAFEVMRRANWHTYMVLTKRAETASLFLKMIHPMEHVYIGTTAGTQRSANERWGSMTQISQMGWNTWVSSEPRLESINWHGWEFLKRLVTGGESGPYARPMSPVWPRADRDWCQAHGVKFWFKQWGEWGPVYALKYINSIPPEEAAKYPRTTLGGEVLYREGRNKISRILDDDRTWEEE